MIPRSIAVGVGKGGTGKTFLSTNVAQMWAQNHGETILLVDCDTQASASLALGMADITDEGRNLFEAVLKAEPLQPASNRDNLHVVTAGTWTRDLANEIAVLRHHDPARALQLVSAPFEGLPYDAAIFDLPPTGQSPLADAIMASVETLVVPTGIQAGELTGVPTLAKQLAADLSTVDVLGVVLNAVPRRQTRTLSRALTTLASNLSQDIELFKAVIPEAKAACNLAWEEGDMISELTVRASGIGIDERKQRSREGLANPPANLVELCMELSALTDEIRERFTAAIEARAAHT